MPGYRCFLFGVDGHIIRRIEYQADTDALAIIEGRGRYIGTHPAKAADG